MDQLQQAGWLLGQRMSQRLPEAARRPKAGLGHGAIQSGLDPTTSVRILRPPGALPEAQLSETCSRCGKCIETCPADCIKLEEGLADGLPHIVARQSPCVVCDDLACMNVCPTGALRLVGRVSEIHMGSAVVDFERCLRNDTGPGQDCRICVSHCPVGDEALGVAGGGRIEVRQGCIGCGVCEWACPTQPPSIVVHSSSS